MRTISAAVVLMFAGTVAGAQQSPDQLPNGQPVLKQRTEVSAAEKPAAGEKHLWILPAGTRIPIQLRQAISTKHARPGDTIYAQTNFPIVVHEQLMVPAGTYVQGVIDSVKRAGRIKGTAELQFHLTTFVFSNGYTVDLAAAIDDVPGDEDSHMKEPGTLKHDSEKGKDLERIGKDASEGAAIGSVAGAAATRSIGGFGVGGLTGIAAGTLIAVLARGSDLRIENGAAVNVVLNHALALDQDKVMRSAMLPGYVPAQPR